LFSFFLPGPINILDLCVSPPSLLFFFFRGRDYSLSFRFDCAKSSFFPPSSYRAVFLCWFFGPLLLECSLRLRFFPTPSRKSPRLAFRLLLIFSSSVSWTPSKYSIVDSGHPLKVQSFLFSFCFHIIMEFYFLLTLSFVGSSPVYANRFLLHFVGFSPCDESAVFPPIPMHDVSKRAFQNNRFFPLLFRADTIS